KETATPCTDSQYPETPNNGYGYGVINALKAVTSVMTGISDIKGQVSEDAEDTVPPTFNHIPIKEAYAGFEQKLKIDVQDNISVKTVELQYRNNPSDEWTTVAAQRESGDIQSGSYEAIIPADRVAGANLSYRWRIVDFGKNEVTSDIYTILVNSQVGYFNDFETDITGWEILGAPEWQWGKPTTGPMAAASGEKVFATNLEGTYSENQVMALISPKIVLPKEHAYLQFKNWYDIEENYAIAKVGVQIDGNDYFTSVAKYAGTKTGGYSNEEIDISEYAGKKVSIYFVFMSGTSASNNHQGWFIDDVKLTDKSAALGNTSVLSNGPKEQIRLKDLPAASDGRSVLSNSPKQQVINSVQANTEMARLPLSATVTIVENGRSTKTNPQDGSYSFKVKEGAYTLRAEKYGYYPQDHKVQVAANQVLENTNITMAPIPKGTLTGKITNAQTGKPVKNAKLYLIEDAAVAPVTTDAEGNYSLTAYEGKYTVQVIAEDYFDEKVTVDINKENVTHDIQQKPFINYSGEIGYDDGTAEDTVAQFEPGGGYAVRMSLPAGETRAIVTSGLFMFGTKWPTPGGKTFKVAVYDASGKDGAPGKMIAGPFNATTPREEGKWTVVDLSAKRIVVTGDYYMVLIQDQPALLSPGISLDKTTVPTGRSWWFVNGGPFNLANKDFGNIMIRSTVKLEALAPVITSPVENPYVNNENVTIKGMAAPGMDVQIFSGDKDIANGKTNDDGSFSIDAVLQEGVNILKAKTIAELGSTPYSTETRVIVDKASPVLEITSPQNIANINDQVITVTGTAKDDYLDYVDVNGTSADIDSNGYWTVKLMSKEGENVINVVARDKAGNETAKSITVNVKYSIREIKNIMPSSDVILKANSTVKVEFDSEPGLKKAVFSINTPFNGIASTAFVPTASLSSFEVVMTEVKDANGTGTGHYKGYWTAPKNLTLNGAQIAVNVEDMYGNSLSSTAAGKLYVNCKPIPKPVPDKTAPSIPLVSKLTYTGISGKAEIGSKVYAKAGKVIIGSSVVNSKGIYSITFKSQKVGTIINVYAVDKSGNVGAAKKVVIKDSTPPAIPSVKSLTNTKVTGKAEPGAKVYVKKGKEIIGSSTANSKGIYTVSYKKQKVGTVLYVYAKDKAGNTGKAKKVVVKK
ncbi:Ig-like domain-containing protein, partial [Bacillus sp. AFS041924]|uniref:Ig-like domain-containing protein n=1 Tax=Bacillus sp. AFS041924 TaxID=2033503 RepID=UPI000BFCDDDE